MISWRFQIPPPTIPTHGRPTQFLVVDCIGNFVDYSCGIREFNLLTWTRCSSTGIFQHQYLESHLVPGTEVGILLELSRASAVILVLM